MAELFQTTKQNVSLHIQHVFEEGELSPEATVKQYLTVQTEGNRQIRRAVDQHFDRAIEELKRIGEDERKVLPGKKPKKRPDKKKPKRPEGDDS
jgi:hypothetical protein